MEVVLFLVFIYLLFFGILIKSGGIEIYVNGLMHKYNINEDQDE